MELIGPVPKQNRVTAIATENELPIIALVQSVSSSRCATTEAFKLTMRDRLVFFFLNNFESSMQEGNYFGILLFEPEMGTILVLLYLDPQQQEELITQLFRTIRYSLRNKRRCSWVALHSSRWPPVKLLMRKPWGVRRYMGL